MSSRPLGLLSLALSSAAALGALSASYGLVYPARAVHDKSHIALALFAGCLGTCLAGALSLIAHRRAVNHSERFLALLGIIIGGYFLFVIAFGFGIPGIVLGTGD